MSHLFNVAQERKNFQYEVGVIANEKFGEQFAQTHFGYIPMNEKENLFDDVFLFTDTNNNTNQLSPPIDDGEWEDWTS